MSSLRVSVVFQLSARAEVHYHLRHRLLNTVLISVVMGVSIPTQLEAQPTDSPIEDPSATRFQSTKVCDLAYDTGHKLASHLISTLGRPSGGISMEPVYYGEVFTNARGGLSTNNATQYQALLDLPVEFDFQKLRLPLPGKFFLLAQNTHGRGLPQRDDDVLGAGVAWAELFEGGTNQETAFEFFYKARITSRVSLQPDLQYIVTPSGIHRDALAVGLRFQVTF